MNQRAAADLNRDSLLGLLQRDDSVGVLSIFADASPGARGTEIDLRNRLTELVHRVRDDGSSALAAALEHVEPELHALADPAGEGRGRALFVPLSGGKPTRLVTHLGLANRVVLDERPFIHPLLECVERGRPAGVVLLSNDEAELFEWRDAELLVLGRLVAEEDAPRERGGPVVAVAGRHQQTTPVREQRQRRARDRRRRFVDRVSPEVAKLASRRAWDRLVVSGGDPLTRPLIDSLPAPLREHTLRDARHLIDLDTAAIAGVVGELLDEHRAERDVRLTESVRDAAMAGHGGALGLSEVAAALNDARVDHLIYDPRIRFAGAIASNGRLFVPPERHPLGETMTPEPRLTERIVERCLATAARVTPVSGPAAAMLTDMGGIAARLRW